MSSRIVLTSALVIFVVPRAFSQVLGQLLYATRAGRAISLKVIDGGHPARISLRPEVGDAEAFRAFILTHAGQEGLATQSTYSLPERAPIGWKVSANRVDTLLKSPEATYWRYTGSWVIPVRFPFKGQEWELLSADLPPRMFVTAPGKAQ